MNINYTTALITGLWSEEENPHYACECDVVKEKWKEVESTMDTLNDWYSQYSYEDRYVI